MRVSTVDRMPSSTVGYGHWVWTASNFLLFVRLPDTQLQAVRDEVARLVDLPARIGTSTDYICAGSKAELEYMMKITPRRYPFTSIQSLTSCAVRVTGPLAFLKLALEDLDVPFLYSRRTMSIDAGQGASFHVRHFDLPHDLYYHDEATAPGQPKGLRGFSLLPSPTYLKGQWLVSKHIAPVSRDEREIFELDEQSIDAYKLAAISLEMRILAHEPLRKHPNIVDLVGFMWERHPDEFGRRWPVLVLKDADCGTLSNFARLDIAPLDSLPIALSIAEDIACGLECLHACGVVHGDLKFENILIFEQPDGAFCAKVSDFGLSSVAMDLGVAGITTLRLPVFSRPWEPPEAYHDVLLENLPMIDVYGFGLLLCRLMTGGSDIFEQYHNRDGGLLEPASSAYNAANVGQTGGVGPLEKQQIEENEGGRGQADEVMLCAEEYDFDNIQKLKKETDGMINYAKTYLRLKSKASAIELEKLFKVVECSLHLQPDCRHSMDDIKSMLLGEEITEVESTSSTSEKLVPPLFDGIDLYSQGIPEEIYAWSLNLTLAVRDDIVKDMIAKSQLHVANNQPNQIKDVADASYWLCLWSISGDLGMISYEDSLKWLMTAAENGSTKARARIWNVHAALGIPFPHHQRGELEQWLVDAVLQGEHPGQSSLMELFPQRLSGVMEQLQTVYCGYGQDCFGDRWREAYPLENLERFMEIILHSGLDINELHTDLEMACSMTWLHYAASMGHFPAVQLLLQQGSNPNILNGFEETAFYMACQAGHYDIACYLSPLTEPTSRPRMYTELHFLDNFDEAIVEDMASKLLGRGIDIDSEDSIGRTPLNAILDRDGVRCMGAIQVLLRKGADPLFKDDKRIHPLSQAAVNFSISQFKTIISYVPSERRLEAQADVLWALMELSLFESLARGGVGYCRRLRDILEALVDDDVCQQFEIMTGHPLLSFACATASIEMVRVLLNLRPKAEVSVFRGSLKDWHSPLHAAVVQNRLDVVELLLESGADPTMPNHAEWTPLFYAAIRSPELVSCLLRHVFATKPRGEAMGFLDKRDLGGATAFSTAVAGEFFESANILARYGTDYLAFTLPYSSESSCLMNILGWSCYMAPQVKYLFSITDNPSAGFIIDNEGTTILHCVAGFPIDRATEEEAQELLVMVLQRFSNPQHANCRDSQGMTPLHFAGRFGHVLAVEMLYKVFGEAMDLQAINADRLTALDEAEKRAFHDIEDLGKIARKEYGIRTHRTAKLLKDLGVRRSSENP